MIVFEIESFAFIKKLHTFLTDRVGFNKLNKLKTGENKNQSISKLHTARCYILKDILGGINFRVVS